MSIILRELGTHLDELTSTYDGCLNFGAMVKEHLVSTPWADQNVLFESLQHQDAVLMPLYQVHYESLRVEKNFRLQTHTVPRTLFGSSSNPSVDHIKGCFDRLGFPNFPQLLNEISAMKADFHDQVYIGHAPQYSQETPLPNFIKVLQDKTLAQLYEKQAKDGIKSEDFLFEMALRFDYIFTDQPIRVHLVGSIKGNTTVGESNWPVIPLNNDLNSISVGLNDNVWAYHRLYLTKLRACLKDKFDTPPISLSPAVEEEPEITLAYNVLV